jgi:hypothetical protein
VSVMWYNGLGVAGKCTKIREVSNVRVSMVVVCSLREFIQSEASKNKNEVPRKEDEVIPA